LIVALKPPDVLRVSLNPQVTFFGSLAQVAQLVVARPRFPRES
jgi:hypothetical protein